MVMVDFIFQGVGEKNFLFTYKIRYFAKWGMLFVIADQSFVLDLLGNAAV
jgi:hypothetical protein